MNRRPTFEEVKAWARTPEARLGRPADHRVLYATAAVAAAVVATWVLLRWKWPAEGEVAPAIFTPAELADG